MSPKKEFIPYLFLFAGVFCLFSLLSFQVSDESGSLNWFGRLGYFFAYGIFFLLGKSAYLIGLGFLGIGGYLFKKPDLDVVGKLLQLPLLVVSVSLALSFLLDSNESDIVGSGGGALGGFLGAILDFSIGGTGKAILTAFLFAYSAFAIINDESLTATKSRILQLMNLIQEKINSFSGWKLPNKMNFAYSGSSMNQVLPNIQTADWKQFFLEKKREMEEKKINRLQASRMEPIQEPSSWNTSSTEQQSPRKETQKRKIYPKFKNASLYEGFFEDEKIFRFHSTPVRLKRKLSETPDSNTLGFSILDYRRGQEEGENSMDWEENQTNRSGGIEILDFSKSTNIDKDNENDYGFAHAHANDNDNSEFENKVDFDHNSDRLDDLEENRAEEDSVIRNTGEEKVGFEGFIEGRDLSELDSGNEEIPEESIEKSLEEIDEEEPIIQEERIHSVSPPIQSNKSREPEDLPKTYIPQVPLKKGGYYISPRLLGGPKAKPLSTESKADSDRVARKIEEIISHYGIDSKVVSMERGPIITRYELTIPNGIKLNKITSLDSELKLYLAVKSIRIVAPIPGKSSIGIEVPNRHREDVFLTDILRETSFAKAQGGLSICIGKDISGKPINIDLTKLPHLLVAGTTGSGKSVCLNSMVTSLIYSRSPLELRFIMIDPKMVEMTLYEEIPHLLMPVIVDPRKATKALSWAIQEMEARYQTISTLKCRDFMSYNLKVDEWAHKKGYEKMPYIVIVIDELSDLMMVSGKELEEQIQRISQKSRAVGIHLVMATQRPSVDVITGLIKANCPARMAFQVAQKTDSRTILDTNGAEALLGKGDFLYRSPTASDLVRIQAPFVTEAEIETIVEETKKMADPGFVEINWDEETSESSDGFEEDEKLIEDAWRVICIEGKASGSMIQRHLRIGYNKAARVIDILEKRGIISPQIGTKPREILKMI